MYIKPNLTTPQTVSMVSDAIENRIPFSLSRLGNGEIYFLNNTCPESLKIKFCKLWGYKYPEDFQEGRAKIVEIIESGIAGADILGILDPKSPIAKSLMRATGDEYRPSWWSITQQTLERISPCVHICDHQISRTKEFGIANNFKHILNGRSLHIISPNKNLIYKNLSEILNADVKIFVSDNNRETILRGLDLIDSDVIIYGASVTGKDIGTIMKSRGKVAIDFGSTLDAWSGLITRPSYRAGGAQEYCVIK